MFKRLLIVFLFISFNSFSQPADSTNISIIDSKDLRGGVWLVSKWQFQNGDQKTFQSQTRPSETAPWHSVKLDSTNSIYKQVPDFKGIGWLRIYLKYDSTVTQEYFGIRFQQNGASILYVNGKIINKLGRFSSDKKKGYMTNTEKTLFYTESPSDYTEILIKYENPELTELVNDKTSGRYIGVRVGDASSIAFGGLITTLFTVFSTLFFTIFFVHFVLFLFYPKNFSNLYFSIFNLALSVFCYVTLSGNLKATNAHGEKLFASFLIVVALVTLSALFNYLFGKFKTRFFAIAVVVLLSVLSGRVFNSDHIGTMTAFAIALVLLEATYLTIKAHRAKVSDTIILLIGIGACFLFVSLGIILGLVGGEIVIGFIGMCILLGSFAILLSITAFLASKIARTNESLSRQLGKVEKLSNEKEHILKTQNEFLEQQVNERTSELQLEKEKSDNLLLNILPQEVAEELKNTGKTEAQHYDEVSVLFTDFVSFTSISEKLGVGELIHELNENFTAFDHIMEKHGLEKIKTIGDAYLAVSGLPNKNGNHAKAAILAALDILEYVENRKKTSPYALDIRIGIHSGPLVAGIVGVKKFAFDIWGDTVNTAARMEQNSESGRINISAGTYALVQDTFNCEAREVISVKGKGDMEMYFIKSIKG